jgi:hypothetical protein
MQMSGATAACTMSTVSLCIHHWEIWRSRSLTCSPRSVSAYHNNKQYNINNNMQYNKQYNINNNVQYNKQYNRSPESVEFAIWRAVYLAGV